MLSTGEVFTTVLLCITYHTLQEVTGRILVGHCKKYLSFLQQHRKLLIFILQLLNGIHFIPIISNSSLHGIFSSLIKRSLFLLDHDHGNWQDFLWIPFSTLQKEGFSKKTGLLHAICWGMLADRIYQNEQHSTCWPLTPPCATDETLFSWLTFDTRTDWMNYFLIRFRDFLSFGLNGGNELMDLLFKTGNLNENVLVAHMYLNYD